MIIILSSYFLDYVGMSQESGPQWAKYESIPSYVLNLRVSPLEVARLRYNVYIRDIRISYAIFFVPVLIMASSHRYVVKE